MFTFARRGVTIESDRNMLSESRAIERERGDATKGILLVSWQLDLAAIAERVASTRTG